MTLETVNIGLLGENCYLLSTEKAVVIIDPGMADTRVLEFLEENKGKQIAVLLTHCHFDHIGGVEKICSLFKAKVIIGEKEADGLNDPDVNLSHRFHYRLGKIIPDMLLSDGEKFSVGDINFEAILVPGHTVGGMCYKTEDMLFTGDTLFYSTIGRTDFIGGDADALISTLKKIVNSNTNLKVYPGHGPDTTLFYERDNNSFLK